MSINITIASLGFIGAGNMATAILEGVVAKKLLPPSQCFLTDVIADKPAQLAAKLGVNAVADARAVLQSATSVVLATKPQNLPEVLQSIATDVTPQHCMISIAAGVGTKTIESILPPGTRVVRVMPNTPALVGEGAAGVAPGSHATGEDVAVVVALFEAVGIAAEVPESHLDAITALSGSGPAYVFRFMELMSEAGVALGLDPDLALRFTLQTFKGASTLALQSDDAVGELRRKVTSPGGTTAAALEVFEKLGLEKTIKDGLTRARDRSIELAKQAER